MNWNKQRFLLNWSIAFVWFLPIVMVQYGVYCVSVQHSNLLKFRKSGKTCLFFLKAVVCWVSFFQQLLANNLNLIFFQLLFFHYRFLFAHFFDEIRWVGPCGCFACWPTGLRFGQTLTICKRRWAARMVVHVELWGPFKWSKIHG